jgi:topoisomerase IA-like protein
MQDDPSLSAIRAGNGIPIGQDPQTGKDVFLRVGPYGPYVQLGESPVDEADPKPVRAPVKLKGCARTRLH